LSSHLPWHLPALSLPEITPRCPVRIWPIARYLPARPAPRNKIVITCLNYLATSPFNLVARPHAHPKRRVVSLYLSLAIVIGTLESSLLRNTQK
jgi:hypothetical protein